MLSVALVVRVVSVGSIIIEYMFEDVTLDLDEDGEVDIANMSTAELARSVLVTHQAHQAAGCRMLIFAAAWADAHPRMRPVLNEAGQPCPGGDRGRTFGADSNPEASEFCPVEFGALQATSTAAAALVIGDALDLRHRLPLIWHRIVAGEVAPSKARKVAQATRQLSDEAAALVDRGIVEHLATLPWTRFLLVLSSLVIEADPQAAEQRARAAERDRFVRAGQANAEGLKLLIAQANAGDVITFMAMVNRIAEILAFDGDPDPADVRRSKAIGILAQPAYALHLLIAHQNQAGKAATTNEASPANDVVPTEDLVLAEDVKRVERRFADAAATEAADSEDDAPTDDRHWADTNFVPSARPRSWPGSESPVDDAQSAANETRSHRLSEGEPADDFALPEDPASVDRHRSVTLDNPFHIDYRKLRPKIKLFVHLTDQALRTGTGVARYNDVGPVTVDQVRRFLTGAAVTIRTAPRQFAALGNSPKTGHPAVAEGATGATPTDAPAWASGYDIRIQPVLDPANIAPVDAYEIPLRLREAVQLRNPADVYPYGTCTSHRMDLDHTRPYRPLKSSTPAGQTSLGNLGPLDRTHHRDKTHGRGSLRQPAAGIYLYRSPEGWIYLTTNAGTLCLGNTDYAHEVWIGAQPWTLTA